MGVMVSGPMDPDGSRPWGAGPGPGLLAVDATSPAKRVLKKMEYLISELSLRSTHHTMISTGANDAGIITHADHDTDTDSPQVASPIEEAPVR
jgi:hypothetical protein